MGAYSAREEKEKPQSKLTFIHPHAKKSPNAK
jgi:hypothetical protein